jgi:hypothetical protein
MADSLQFTKDKTRKKIEILYDKSIKGTRPLWPTSRIIIYSQKKQEKGDTEGWSIFADLEPAIVAPGSVIPHFPARKRKFNIEDSFYDDI